MRINPWKAALFSLLVLAFAPALRTTAAQPSLPLARPEDVGLSSVRLQNIGAMVERLIAERWLPGAVVLIARQGKVAYFESFGVMDVETKMPLRTDAIFRMASMTKPPVSVAAMILWEQGRFKLEDPVGKYLPEFNGLKVFQPGGREKWSDPAREMTIEDLLRHTSGLVYAPAGPEELKELFKAAKLGDRKVALQEFVARLGALPLTFSPGEKWVYGRSTDVLGRVIEAVAGQPIDAVLKETVFAPLAMADTGFFVPPEAWERTTSLHKISEPGTLEVGGKPGKDRYSGKPAFLEPGGGLVSTAVDYFRLAQMLLNRGELDGVRLLRSATVDLMTANRVPPPAMPLTMGDPDFDWMVKGCGFGLGFRVLVDPAAAESAASPGSYGWYGANDTYFLVDPKEQLVGIFLSQVSLNSKHPYPGVREFQELVYQCLVR
jgi:CubicO group peptidase (beta-lactamase class C family)